MKKFIIVNPYDFMLLMPTYSHPLRAMSQMFYKINSVQYLKDNDIEVIPLINFLNDINLKYELRDYNLCEKYYKDGKTNGTEELKKFFYQSITNLMEQIKNTDNYNNSIIYAIQPLGFDPFLKKIGNGYYDTNNFDYLEKKKIKVMIYHDDLHGFLHASGINKEKVFIDDPSKLQFRDIRLDRASLILSHAQPFFKWLNVYIEKTLLYFTPIDDILFSMYTPENFYERKDKIVLSGAIGQYPIRALVYKNLAGKNEVAIKFFEHMQHFGSSFEISSFKLGGSYSYYNQLSKYRGSIVGFYKKPLNHVLYKTFESLVAGTLLFCEEHPTFDLIGMKKFVHFVPVTETNVLDSNYLNIYMNTDIGKKIAINGHNFVKEYMGNKKNLDFFIDLINKL